MKRLARSRAQGAASPGATSTPPLLADSRTLGGPAGGLRLTQRRRAQRRCSAPSCSCATYRGEPTVARLGLPIFLGSRRCACNWCWRRRRRNLERGTHKCHLGLDVLGLRSATSTLQLQRCRVAEVGGRSLWEWPLAMSTPQAGMCT